ncbi:stage II sporulation protein M [Sedimenticola thiotaurini]|uniref:Membrane protein n=1 Tax=Sedimenticola thiotaurini TaxID=1543721 RepID=A0A0F7JVJ0_9GAMM|nr:stage II sporulation protein M [Sedimenticola thiotaurini]AKH20561.1 membrane protein [Sedimenticola thiotaurini]
MRQRGFEQQHREQWERMGQLLDDLDRSSRRRQHSAAELDALPGLYREVCNHYAIARSRHYSPALEQQLHELVLRGHRQLYSGRTAELWRLVQFIAYGFPCALRRQIRYFWLAAALLLLPGLLLGGFCYLQPDVIYSVMDEDQVATMESMYDPANRKPGRSLERTAETDLMMFGHYISNNIGIGFRTFAGGILFGLGTVLLLLFNGVVLGAVAGHLTRIGYQETFWSFVSGHGAFELTAIVICGASGLIIGHALIAPGRLPRLAALKQRARVALPLVMGAAFMLLIAAFVEAFWSSSSLSAPIKYAVAGLFWMLVLLYLGLAGRKRHGTG